MTEQTPEEFYAEAEETEKQAVALCQSILTLVNTPDMDPLVVMVALTEALATILAYPGFPGDTVLDNTVMALRVMRDEIRAGDDQVARWGTNH